MFNVVFGVCKIDNFVEGSNLYYHKAPCCSFTCLFFLYALEAQKEMQLNYFSYLTDSTV